MMKAREIGNMMIRVYERVYKTKKPLGDWTLREYLDNCTRDAHVVEVCTKLAPLDKHRDEELYKKTKVEDYCSTISCLCDTSGRNSKIVSVRNPLIVIDIDADDNEWMSQPGKLDAFISGIYRSRHVYAVGRSCSGRGVYVIFLIAQHDNDAQFRASFRSLEAEMKEHGIKPDPACKDIARTRFASMYPPLIKPDDEEIVPYEGRLEPAVPEHDSESVLPNDIIYGIPKEEILKEVVRMIMETGFNASHYMTWVQIAFFTKNLGPDLGYWIFRYISERSDNYRGEWDVRNKFDNLGISVRNEADCYGYFFNMAFKRFGPAYAATAAKRIRDRRQASKK